MRLTKQQEIFSAFTKYARTADKSLIEKYSIEDLGSTLLQYSADQGSAPYIAIEKRISELRDIQSEEKREAEKRKDRVFAFLLKIAATVIGGLLVILLVRYLTGK